MGWYAKLKDMGIDMSLRRARELLANGERQVQEHDIHPHDMQPCTTSMHRGERGKSVPHAQFEIPNGGASIYVCRYCLYILAQARLQRNHGLAMELRDSARRSIDVPAGDRREH